MTCHCGLLNCQRSMTHYMRVATQELPETHSEHQMARALGKALRLLRQWCGTSLGVHVDTVALQRESADLIHAIDHPGDP